MSKSLSAIENHLKSNPNFYVSITGLKIRSPLAVPFFWWHAVRSKIQADRAPGLLFSAVNAIDGIQHTVTAWESKEAMRVYIFSGAHKKAIKAFRKIATGKTFGFEATKIPAWDEVHELWKKHGKEY